MKIVFFGDSVTDAARDRENPNDLGNGFVLLAANKLKLLYPDKNLQIVNRGISGDRTTELLARIETDVIAEQPHVVVMLIGINDIGGRFLGKVTTEEQFRENYVKLIEIIEATGAKLILIEPFVLDVPMCAVFRPFVNSFNKVVHEVAGEKYPVIPIDEIFRNLAQDVSPATFAEDGVHPSPEGCRCISDRAVEEIQKLII